MRGIDLSHCAGTISTNIERFIQQQFLSGHPRTEGERYLKEGGPLKLNCTNRILKFPRRDFGKGRNLRSGVNILCVCVCV